MRTIFNYVITLPLLAMPVSTLALKPAGAETVGPVAALELLAQSKAADARCHILFPNERDELSGYLARAEIAAAERMSVGVAQAAIASGKARGASSLCDTRAAVQMRATLEAAREATSGSAEPETAVASSEPPAVQRAIADPPVRKIKPVAEAQPRKRLFSFKAEKQAVALPVKGSLQRYAREAAAYYADRKCRHLSSKAATSFWNGVVIRHRAAVAVHGSNAVAAVLANAQVQANSWGCGRQVNAAIGDGYASSQQR